MVKLTGPMFSFSAHGGFGQTVIFAKQGKTAYAKKHFSPTNPRSDAQSGIRCMAKFLTQHWRKMSSANQAKYSGLAEKYDLGNYHAWLKYNAMRWNSHRLPVIDLNVNYTYKDPDVEISKTVDGRDYTIVIDASDDAEDIATLEISIDTNPSHTPSRNTAKFILEDQDPGMPYGRYTIEWTAPDDQTYYVKTRYGLTSGNPSPWYQE